MQPSYKTEILVPPQSDPVTLEEVRRFLNLEDNTDDDLLRDLIKDATSVVEEKTNSALINRTVRTFIDTIYSYYNDYYDSSSLGGDYGYSNGVTIQTRQTDIRLPRAPFYSMVGIQYRSRGSDTFQPWPQDQFYYDRQSRGYTRVRPTYAGQWPQSLAQGNAMQIDYVVGYGEDSNDVPAAIRLAIKQYIAWLYDNRDGSMPVPQNIFAKLKTFKPIKGLGG